MKTFSLHCAVLAGGLLTAPHAAATPHSSDLLQLSLKELMEVTVTTASRQAESAANAPGTVYVVTQQQIRERGYVNLYQLLEDLPSVDTHSYASNTEFNRISIRGMVRNDKFILMQDGVRIHAPSGEPTPVSDNLPLYHVKQVEIVYGPASALYGADAFTGVINLITQDAADIEGVRLTAVGGDFASRALYAHAGTQFGNGVSLSGGAHWQSSDNPDLAEFYPQDFALDDLVTFNGDTVVTAQDRQGYLGDTRSSSAYFKLALPNRLTFGGNYWAFRHRTDTASLPSTTDYGGNAYWDTDLAEVYANYRFDLSAQLKGFAQVDYARYEVDPQSHFTNIYTNFENGYKYVRGSKKQFEAQLDYAWSDTDTLLGGVSFADYFSQPKPVDLTRPYNRDLPSDAQGFYYLGTNNSLPIHIFQVNYTNIGAYLQWQRQWRANLSSTIGVRYDHSSSYGTTINPRLGLVYQPQAATTLKLLYGTAFLTPSPFLAYEHYGSFSGQTDDQGRYTSSFLNIPNADLQPEEIQTLEANLSHNFNPNLELHAGLYYSRADNLIFRMAADPQQPYYIPGGNIAYTQYNGNIGNATAYGGELGLNYLHRFDNGSYLKLWGNYSYTGGELSRDGAGAATDLPNVAAHKLKLGLTYTYQSVTLSPKLLWIGDTASPSVATDNPSQALQVPGYTRLDLHSEWQANKNLSLFVTVWNLLDTRYRQATDDVSVYFVGSPQDPRRIYAGIAYQFQ